MRDKFARLDFSLGHSVKLRLLSIIKRQVKAGFGFTHS
jgi:hypothetical protein